MPNIRTQELHAPPPPLDIAKLPKHRRDWLEVFGEVWKPRKSTACDACVYGDRYQHAEWCHR